MAIRPLRARRATRRAALIATITSLALILTPASAQAQSSLDGAAAGDGDAPAALPDLDTRGAALAVASSSAQQELVAALDATARWSTFGTAQSLIRHGDYLATEVPGADPGAAARSWLVEHGELYQLESTAELRVHAQVALTDQAHVVIFQQHVDGVPVAPEGKAAVGLVGSAEQGWAVAYAAGLLVPQDSLAGTPRPAGGLTMSEAVAAAASDAGFVAQPAAGSTGAAPGDWQSVELTGIGFPQLVRPVVFPAPEGSARPAYETNVVDGQQAGYRHIIDAASGEVLYRESIVDDGDDFSEWEVYPARPPMTRLGSPPWGFPGADRRDRWCWTPQPGCALPLANDAAPVPWDVDARSGEPTFTTTGNAVTAAQWWDLDAGAGHQPVSDQRSYRFPWHNAWYDSGCDSRGLAGDGNDIEASTANLFAANSRLHNWAYHLGFTEETWNAQEYNFGVNPEGEGDPVIARAQAGAVEPGLRNNATMATRPDGTSSIMSMFLWQPQANAFYGPCVVGDFDMSVVGHEYTHMIENRLIGKGSNRSGFHAGAMGESWSDFISMEYHQQYGLLPGGSQGWAVGAYATGNPDRGIRNYNMSLPSAGAFPRPGTDARVGSLQFGSMGYDLVGPQVHADSQIWSATNHDLRALFLERYPSPGRAHQVECADGLRPVDECPGNRRWIQLAFDAMLLMPTGPTMLDARDAYFAADLLRFEGANQDLLWLGFARRGFGEHAEVAGTQDTNPVPSFASPEHEPATLHFEALAQDSEGQPVEAEVFAGNYEARATPLAPVEQFVPHPEGYNFVARADGYGHVRFFVDNLQPGEERTVTIHFPTNVASAAQGASAEGVGQGHGALLDDTEATNWESHSGPVEDAWVVIDLAGEQSFSLANASAMLLPDQNRFTALRQFALYSCTAGGPHNPDCDGDTDAGWDQFLRSHRDAFPGPNPRPSAPDLVLRSFEIPQTTATHVKLVVLSNQCTGYRGYQGQQHADPTAPNPDCRSTGTGAEEVRAAAVQLLSGAPRVDGATLVD